MSDSCPLTTVSEEPPARPHRRALRGLEQEHTVDGLRLKPAYVEYYKQLRALVELAVMALSKHLGMKEYDEVHSLGRQLYEILRELFVDEPFKLWLEANAAKLSADDAFRGRVHKIVEEQLEATAKTTANNTLKNVVLNVLNNELSGDSAAYDVSAGYIKPNCIVLTFTCCDLTFEP
ncbi:unknown [Antheraea pernyi nucleopolyhedrovirus]|uniref:Uncharacterized protein n=2 Tax=Antheraea pernyi nuclear polyhedrosis virus TaxID=161494 RepID=Q1HH18_NPVAP|nr:hypothetical protein APNV_p080 [Antheraea pernyi nucleopolyhedrovirus]AWD33599.1 hypothetical protein [Antheraea proylei nucleopolyhedrovirus]BBD50536.1 hypothetical protein [Antheraea yamamai nucleopolyhedrovirus]BBD50688.1 hypothetical protein [Samia cynthia nucleopolyhedrovirus]ABF50315.1 unknown [Antheraea pernyi nucleopolyhedrovirus]ABQ12307.1 unknown [Antheraea pernyi nucleopolyhedrovirus]